MILNGKGLHLRFDQPGWHSGFLNHPIVAFVAKSTGQFASSSNFASRFRIAAYAALPTAARLVL